MSELSSRMSTTPLAAPALALAAGIAYGRYAPPWPGVAVCGAAVIAAAVYLCLPFFLRAGSRKSRLLYGQRNALWLLAIPAFMLLGILAISGSKSTELDEASAQYATGVVTDATSATDGDRLVVKVDALISDMGRKQSVRPFKVLVRTGACDTQTGDKIMFRLNASPVSGDDMQDPGYAEFLYARGIDYTSSTLASKIKVTGRDGSLRFKALEWRDRAVSLIWSTPLDRDTKAFLSAFLTGDKESLSPGIRERFAAAGIAHILALSGLHAGIILLLLGWFLMPLDLAGARTLRFALMGAGILLFALFTGLGPSVVRASVMAVCMLGGWMLQRPGSTLNGLCLAACLILFFDPRALFDAGFQLSFLCTLTILTLGRTLPVTKDNRRLMRIISALAIPCAIFLVTWPLTAWHFHSVPLLFLPLNLVLLPLLPLFMSCALLYLALYAAGIPFTWLGTLVEKAYHIIDGSAGAIASVDSAQVSLYPHWLIPVSAILAALCLFYWLHTRSSRAGIVSLTTMLGVLVAAIALPDNTPPDSLSIPCLYDRMEVRHTRSGETRAHLLRDGSATMLRLPEATILYLDTRLPYGPAVPDMKTYILIVGKNCDSHPDSVLHHITPSRLILAPGLYPNQADRWREAAANTRVSLHALADSPYTIPL